MWHFSGPITHILRLRVHNILEEISNKCKIFLKQNWTFDFFDHWLWARAVLRGGGTEGNYRYTYGSIMRNRNFKSCVYKDFADCFVTVHLLLSTIFFSPGNKGLIYGLLKFSTDFGFASIDKHNAHTCGIAKINFGTREHE